MCRVRLFFHYPPSIECKAANVADIVFVVDESSSIGKSNFQLVRDFLRSFVSGMEVSSAGVRVGIVTYSDAPRAQLYLNTFFNKAEILQFISIMPYGKGNTHIGAALNFVREEVFTKERGSRRRVEKVAVVITDGKSQDSVIEAAVALRRAGITVYAVGIGQADERQLQDMASHPPHEHVFNVTSFTDLKPLRKLLQRTVCDSIIESAVTKTKTQHEVKKGLNHS